MIILEKNDCFIMITQHDHAFLSGEIAKHFDFSHLDSNQFAENVIYAAYEHDRGWITLDHTPIWNDHIHTPFSFSDFPLLPKLACYRMGLDEIETVNPYASLLCSLHFCSFFSHSQNEQISRFLQNEKRRQISIKKNISNLDHQLLLKHFRLLQLCDDMSLFICLNEPGTSKEDCHPWFKNGFKHSELFHEENKPLMAEWISKKEISIQSFPFNSEFSLNLAYKVVAKSAIQEMGIAKAYESSLWKEQVVQIRK